MLVNVKHNLGDLKTFVIKHFIIVFSSVATGDTIVPGMLLMNICNATCLIQDKH